MQIVQNLAELSIFFSSSYITVFKILIWYNKSTQMFYVKCMSYIPSLLTAYPDKIDQTTEYTLEYQFLRKSLFLLAL